MDVYVNIVTFSITVIVMEAQQRVLCLLLAYICHCQQYKIAKLLIVAVE